MATERISRFFERLGFKLRNDRNSWGATNDEAVMLRTWDDERRQNPQRVRVFSIARQPGGTTRAGYNERKEHLRAMWAGGIPAYTVIVTAKPGQKADVRSIGDFRSDAVFPIERLIEEDNSIFAVTGKPVPTAMLTEHMKVFSIAANPHPLPESLAEPTAAEPVDPEARAAYIASHMREYLLDAAARKVTVYYGELFDAFDLNFRTLPRILGMIGHECLDRGEPILTALVVLQETGRCAPGLDREFGVDEDVERERVFAWWGSSPEEPKVKASAGWTDEELEASVAAYREMMRLEAAGEPYIKAQYYRELAQRFNRGEGAFERRMQNMSHLLDERGLEWLQGLKPQGHVGANVEPRLLGFLDALFIEQTPVLTFPDEVADLPTVIEGAKRRVVVNAYERDPSAKPRCVKRWGCACVVCGFDFHAVYGELGRGFIHVHHLTPLHTVGAAYELDPENDLRPVCPNCHAMLHRGGNVLSIEELQSALPLQPSSLNPNKPPPSG